MKIGLLGGSFNPIHNGHLAIAQTVQQKLQLDEIWFMPSGKHPLKEENTYMPYQLRKTLIEAAIKNYPDFHLSELDADPDRPSYTDVLIKQLKTIHPQDNFYFIGGYDIVAELPLWHNYRWLLENANLIIVTRPGIDHTQWEKLDYLKKLTFIEMNPVDISSTEIRKKLKSGENISGMVPASVNEILKSIYHK